MTSLSEHHYTNSTTSSPNRSTSSSETGNGNYTAQNHFTQQYGNGNYTAQLPPCLSDSPVPLSQLAKIFSTMYTDYQKNQRLQQFFGRLYPWVFEGGKGGLTAKLYAYCRADCTLDARSHIGRFGKVGSSCGQRHRYKLRTGYVRGAG